MPNHSLAGTVAVITGAASGIGRALTNYAAKTLNMTVVIADIADAPLKQFADELKQQGHKAIPVVTDVRKPEALEHLAAMTLEHAGPARLLINNAGIEALGLSWEMPAEQWQRVVEINILGVVNGIRAFVPQMLASGESSILANLSSIGGVSMAPMQSPYIMSKHAVLSLTENLHLELGMQKANIQVSAILPGPVKTAIFEAVDDHGDDATSAYHRSMQEMLDAHGITPDEAAERIFEQLLQGNFWVSTHPEMTQQMAQMRADYLANLATPSMGDESAFNTVE